MKIIKYKNKSKIFFHYSQIYFFKLKSIYVSLLDIKNLIVFKVKKRQYIMNFIWHFLLLIIKKKYSLSYYRKNICLVGLSNLIKASFKLRIRFFQHLSSYYISKKNAHNYLSRFNNILLRQKIAHESTKKNKYLFHFPLIKRTLKMSKIFFFYYRRRIFKKTNKKKKISKSKYFFSIKRLIRKYGDLTYIHYLLLKKKIFLTQKAISFFIFFKNNNRTDLYFDEYVFFCSFFKNKDLIFCSKTSNFLIYDFKKYFAFSSFFTEEWWNEYLPPEAKTKNLNSKFVRYKHVSKQYAISFVKKKLPFEHVSHIKNRTVEYNVKKVLFVLMLIYFRLWFNTKVSLSLRKLQMIFYNRVNRVFRSFGFFSTFFFRHVYLQSNKYSFLHFCDYLISISKFFYFLNFFL